MKYHLRRIGVLSAMKVGAVLNGGLALLLGIIGGVMMLLVTLLGMSGGSDHGAMGFMAGGIMGFLFMLVVYPIIGVIAGLIEGLVFALLFNITAGIAGGLEIELENK